MIGQAEKLIAAAAVAALGVADRAISVADEVFGLAKVAVERGWGWRSFAWGPPTEHYTHAVTGGTSVEWRQAGALVCWQAEEDRFGAELDVGPLHAWVSWDQVDLRLLHRLGLQVDHHEVAWQLNPAGEWSVEAVAGVTRLGVLYEWSRWRRRLTLGPLGIIAAHRETQPDRT